VRPYADHVVAVTDADCLEHLDIEYADQLSGWLRVKLVDIGHAPARLQVRAFELGGSPTSPGGTMTRRDEVDRLLEVITVDRYNLAEQVTAFYEAFAEAVPLPTTVVGAAVRVLGVDVAEHGEELTARCEREDVVQDLRLSDLVFHPIPRPPGSTRPTAAASA